MRGLWDVHCHIIPGVDDGSRSIKLSMEMLKKEYGDGVRNIILTPHYRRGMFETSRDQAENAYRELCRQTEEDIPDMKLYLGCEYHINVDMAEALEKDSRYRMNGTKYVLMEFSGTEAHHSMYEACRHIRMAGYNPIVAHAERCDAVHSHPDLLDDLHEIGCLIQINAGSIAGDDGWSMKRFCAKLLKNRQIDLVGTDAHNMKDRAPNIGKCAELLEKKYGTGYAETLLIENPAAVAEGKEII